MSMSEANNVSELLSSLKVLSVNPFVGYIDGFRKPEEMADLIASVPDSDMAPAGFYDPTGKPGGDNINTEKRKALHVDLKLGKNQMVDGMRVDVSNIFGVAPDFGEPAVLIRYGVGGEYKVHFDTWHFAQIKNDPSEMELGPRYFTGIVYLNDDFEGGSTTFPHLSLEVIPKVGRLVLWSNTRPGDIGPHPLSAHAGMPVTSGEKNIVSFWLRTSQGAELMKKRLIDETMIFKGLQSMKANA